MGKRGPSRQPTAIKLLRGTHRVDLHGNPGDEPTAGEADLSQIPAELGEHGQIAWKTIGPTLKAAGTLTEFDVPAFTTYCRTYDEAARCHQTTADEGHYITSDTGVVHRHPAATDLLNWLALKGRLEIQFGMTPSARSGLKVEKPKQSGVMKRTRA